MFLFGDIISEDFFAEELESLFDHFFSWVENGLDLLEQENDFMFGDLGIFAVLNHGDEVASVEEGLGLFVEGGHEL